MPRPIVGIPLAANRTTLGTPASRSSVSGALQGPKLQQYLRKQRSKTYVESIAHLDAGTHHENQAGLDSLLQAISDEFPELGIEQRPLGIVSKCYLGPPYEVHICDLSGSIIEHFQTYRPMPPLFERARSLAQHSSYAFIEVYADTLRAVAQDGSVAVIEK